MKRTKLSAVLLALLMILSMLTTMALAAAPTESEAYSAMIAMKSEYPEGMHWTNDNSYAWRGGIYNVGYGCAGFAFILSDAAFGDLPARKVSDFTYDDVKVGDILRIYNDTHSVIVLEKYSDHVVIAEGNYNSSIHWGRELNKSTVMQANYILTRYPAETVPEPPKPVESVKPFTDVPVTAFYADAVRWAVDEDVTRGTSATTFSPMAGCTRGQVVTFLWRALGCPKASSDYNPFTDVKKGAYYYDAVLWAVDNGITAGTSATTFSPDQVCTRAQIVTFLWRSDGAEGWYIESGDFFTDVPESSYYYSAVVWALVYEVTAGTSTTTFSPNDTCTRGQVVTFLYRYMNR